MDLIKQMARTLAEDVAPHIDDVMSLREDVELALEHALIKLLGDRKTMDALLNTYATNSARGVWATKDGHDVVGVNGRYLKLVDSPDGVYVGGVLIADRHDLDDLAATLNRISATREWPV